MKLLLLCLFGFLTQSAIAQPTTTVQSVPHAVPDNIQPNLLPGIAGVGAQVGDNTLPCIGCYGAPAGALVLPPPYYIIAVKAQPQLIFYCSVETGNLSGAGTMELTITEGTTGKVVLDSTTEASFSPHSTTLLSWVTGLPNSDFYKGPETVEFTISVGGYQAKNAAHIWVTHQ